MSFSVKGCKLLWSSVDEILIRSAFSRLTPNVQLWTWKEKLCVLLIFSLPRLLFWFCLPSVDMSFSTWRERWCWQCRSSALSTASSAFTERQRWRTPVMCNMKLLLGVRAFVCFIFFFFFKFTHILHHLSLKKKEDREVNSQKVRTVWERERNRFVT